MGKKFSVFFSTLIFLGLIAPDFSDVGALGQDRKSFLWRVQSATTTVYLLGSIHFLKQQSYPLPEAIESAYEASDVLVVEANVNDIGKLDLTTLMDRAFYRGEDGVQKHVSHETYEWIKRETQSLGIPLELAQKQKPWLLTLSLQALELMRLGYHPRLGVDYHFLSKAQGKKKILELESLEEQIKLLSGFSDREQELFLLYTLKNLRFIAGQVDALARAWAHGDAQTVESILAKNAKHDVTLARIYEKLLDERNVKMGSKIEGYLSSGGSYFVIVGAGHLVGDQGIVEILRAKGYGVEQF
jgi:hypothetical protein